MHHSKYREHDEHTFDNVRISALISKNNVPLTFFERQVITTSQLLESWS